MAAGAVPLLPIPYLKVVAAIALLGIAIRLAASEAVARSGDSPPETDDQALDLENAGHG
jgi:hypothetical protein